MKKLTIILFVFFIVSCSDDNGKNSVDQNLIDQFDLAPNEFEESLGEIKRTFTKKEYLSEVSHIINEGRIALQDSLPFYIHMANNYILSCIAEKKLVVSGSIGKSDDLIKEELNNCDADFTFKALVPEIKVNLIYDKTIKELDNLNTHYFNHFQNSKKMFSFLSYKEEARPFVLAEEVAWKLEEYNYLEKERERKSNSVNLIRGGVMIMELVPGASLCTKILEGIKYGAVAVNKTSKVSKRLKGSKKIAAIITSKLVGKRKALKFISKLSDTEKIKRYSRVSEKAVWIGTSFALTDMGYELLLEKHEVTINEKINEFSAGMIAVYMQQLREIAKKNIELINTLKNE
jgi:hypothetical protein